MLFTILTAVLPAIALAAPTAVSVRAESCAPNSYTISDFTLSTSATSAYLDFNFKSSFASDVGIVDTVISGANCHADGASIPNANECRVADRKLLFDLRAPQDQARYQITHTWTCNGKSWMSGNDVTIDPLKCGDNFGVHVCQGGPQTFAPQNVRQIPSGPGKA